VFVTLNYDTLFESVASKYAPFVSLDAYIASHKYVLVKLHGSVNWGREMDTAGLEDPRAGGYSAACRALAEHEERRLSTEITFVDPKSPGTDIEGLRGLNGGKLYFPALAAPLGPDDEPICPPSHVEALRDRLQQHQGGELHVLIIGYSCLDKSPLRIIKEASNPIRSIVIANGSQGAGQAALERLRSELGPLAPYEGRDSVEIFDGGFAKFSTSDELQSMIDRVGRA
jgi:hypothetical protein